MSCVQVITVWGANVFSMPHMIYLDTMGNVWVIDVGLHQVRVRGVGQGSGCVCGGTGLCLGGGGQCCGVADVWGGALYECLW